MKLDSKKLENEPNNSLNTYKPFVIVQSQTMSNQCCFNIVHSLTSVKFSQTFRTIISVIF